jgi:hypothetical protein
LIQLIHFPKFESFNFFHFNNTCHGSTNRRFVEPIELNGRPHFAQGFHYQQNSLNQLTGGSLIAGLSSDNRCPSGAAMLASTKPRLGTSPAVAAQPAPE